MLAEKKETNIIKPYTSHREPTLGWSLTWFLHHETTEEGQLQLHRRVTRSSISPGQKEKSPLMYCLHAVFCDFALSYFIVLFIVKKTLYGISNEARSFPSNYMI